MLVFPIRKKFKTVINAWKLFNQLIASLQALIKSRSSFLSAMASFDLKPCFQLDVCCRLRPSLRFGMLGIDALQQTQASNP